MKNHLMIATVAIAFAANSFGADWRAIAEAAGPYWKATATGLEAKGPRYHDLPETALDGMEDNAYAYFQSRAVNLWQYAFLGDAKGNDYTLSATVRVLEPAPLKGVRPGQGNIFMNYQWGREAIEGAGARVSMDGKGRWMDNVFIERLWRAVKHEGVYLWAYDNLHELEQALGRWFEDYNHWKPHKALDGKTPWESYRPDQVPRWRQAA